MGNKAGRGGGAGRAKAQHPYIAGTTILHGETNPNSTRMMIYQEIKAEWSSPYLGIAKKDASGTFRNDRLKRLTDRQTEKQRKRPQLTST